ncbi:hypothetical protein FRB90_001780 [Tulasnella sp. 427]|nr:hypothetical protein FRB90_001780 [Tulasnella sp. 427]
MSSPQRDAYFQSAESPPNEQSCPDKSETLARVISDGYWQCLDDKLNRLDDIETAKLSIRALVITSYLMSTSLGVSVVSLHILERSFIPLVVNGLLAWQLYGGTALDSSNSIENYDWQKELQVNLFVVGDGLRRGTSDRTEVIGRTLRFAETIDILQTASDLGPDVRADGPLDAWKQFNHQPAIKQGSAALGRLKHEHSEREEIDSSDEEDPEAAELVSGFDSMGVQRWVNLSFHTQELDQCRTNHQPCFWHSVKASAKSNGPLVIPVLKNRDWRQLARQRQAANGYVPDSARASAMTGPDGSQGGLGTRDSINSGPQLAGLIQKARSTAATQPAQQEPSHSEPQANGDAEMTPAQPLTEDEIALQALLSGTDNTTAVPQVPAIPLAPMTEEAALQRDLTELPETATLDDYARVPVEQFGMAMLRGMGWKPPASGEDELWIPAERPALLGLGAKARPTPQGGGNSRSQALNWKTAARKYVPLVKKDRNGEIVEDAKDTRGSRPGSGQVSRRNSRSRSPHGRRDSSRRDKERDDYGNRDRDRQDRDRDYRDRDRENGDRDRDREYRREKSDRESDRYDRDSRRETDRAADRRRRDRDSDRNYDRRGSSARKDDRDYDSRRR